MRWSSALLFCFQVRGRVVGLLTMGSLIFGIKKIFGVVLCFAVLILPHPMFGVWVGVRALGWMGGVHLVYFYLESFFFKFCN